MPLNDEVEEVEKKSACHMTDIINLSDYAYWLANNGHCCVSPAQWEAIKEKMLKAELAKCWQYSPVEINLTPEHIDWSAAHALIMEHVKATVSFQRKLEQAIHGAFAIHFETNDRDNL